MSTVPEKDPVPSSAVQTFARVASCQHCRAVFVADRSGHCAVCGAPAYMAPEQTGRPDAEPTTGKRIVTL